MEILAKREHCETQNFIKSVYIPFSSRLLLGGLRVGRLFLFGVSSGKSCGNLMDSVKKIINMLWRHFTLLQMCLDKNLKKICSDLPVGVY